MQNGSSIKGRLLELVPAGRLEKYLETVSRSSGFPLRLVDGEMGVLISASPGDGPDDDACADGLWAGLARMHAEGPGELKDPKGGSLLAVPLYYKGERLGMLAVCAHGRPADYERARQVLAISSSHIEALTETGYEVESLSAEVVRVYEELALIYGLISRLGSMVDLHELCRVVADEAAKVLGARDVQVLLADHSAGVFRTALALGEHKADAGGFSPGLEEGLVGASYVGHRPIIVCEVDQDRRHSGWPYPVRRLMTVPLIVEGAVLGMLVATDKRNGDEFNTREEKLVSAMAAVAAISIKNAQLYSDIKGLFEGFINASVTAVESRDPTTAGHSARVACMTVELAKKVDASDLPVFKGVSFSRDDLMEIRYAGLLHDFGKIGVRESVLLKANKLTEERMERIRDRFAYIKERRLREAIEARLDVLLSRGREAYDRETAGMGTELERDLAALDDYMSIVETANNPRILLSSLSDAGRLEGLSKMLYKGPDGGDRPYLTPFEFNNLHVLKGSLNDEERREIESHVSHSYNFLARVPWSKGFSNIADIVHTHHEKLDGSGYPRGLIASEIPIQAKMMSVADIYDALTAWDRPYKDAVSPQKAFFILEMEAAEGKLEPHLVQIFRDAQVYKVVSDMLPEHGGR